MSELADATGGEAVRELNVLVTAASEHGSTRGIAEAVARGLRSRGFTVDVGEPDAFIDVSEHDAFVIGSALYAGRWLEPAVGFVRRFAPTLAERPVWLFSSGPVGDPQRKLVQKMTADPAELPELAALTAPRGHRIFAGRLARTELPRARRLPLTFVRGLEGDWRDWAEIDAWAAEIADSLTSPPSSRGRQAAPTVR